MLKTISGILYINKPQGLTSHNVVGKVRKALGLKRVGHTGTLDPLAIGVLPICVGKATKLAEYLEAGEKQYKAMLQLGIETDTQDITGQIIAKKEVGEYDFDEVIKDFIGKIEQIPPMYSAIKINGQKLYELARRGEKIERKPRKIEVFDIKYKILDKTKIELLIDCSKGTYIRTICHDIGQKIGCGGVMSELTRTKVGNIDLSACINLEEVEESKVKSIDEGFNLPKINLNCEQAFKIKNGVQIEIDKPDSLYKIFDDEELIAFCEVENKIMKLTKSLW